MTSQRMAVDDWRAMIDKTEAQSDAEPDDPLPRQHQDPSKWVSREDVATPHKQLLDLSRAYLRLRALIPGAFDTPHAPSPETIWQVTEDALKKCMARLAQSDAEPVEWRPQVRPEVAAFALLMERELRNNDHKPGWKEDAPDSLARRIVEEAAELLTVATSYEAAALSPVPRKTREQIAEEAADVANMAMMVADVCGALSLHTAPPRPDTQSDAEQFKQCPICGKDEDHEHNDTEVGAWLKTQPDAEPRSAEYWKARYEQNMNDTKDIIEEYNKLAQSDAEPAAYIDLAIDKVLMFRLKRMDDGVIWIRLYRENGDDKVIWLNSPSTITANVEDDKDEPIALPRPDASAELIKVAEIAEERAAQTEGAAQFALQNIATEIRIRAANRSGK